MYLFGACYVCYGCGEEPNEQENGKFADRGFSAGNGDVAEPYAYNEEKHRGKARKKHAAVHALAVEHQEERRVNQGRPRFSLQHD